MLELLVSQLLNPTSHRLDMIDNQFVEIGIAVVTVDNQLAADGLSRGVGIRLCNIWCRD
jgi:hypothetical protein